MTAGAARPRSPRLPLSPRSVSDVVANWPKDAQRRFQQLCAVVHEVAAGDPRVAPLTETLKWGEPSFLTKTGTTLRIAWKAKTPDEIGLFVIFRTDLLDQTRSLYPDAFRYEGTRALFLSLAAPIPEQAVAHLASRTQTYKL